MSVRADCLALPLKSNLADGVICIAVIHHLSTDVSDRHGEFAIALGKPVNICFLFHFSLVE